MTSTAFQIKRTTKESAEPLIKRAMGRHQYCLFIKKIQSIQGALNNIIVRERDHEALRTFKSVIFTQQRHNRVALLFSIELLRGEDVTTSLLVVVMNSDATRRKWKWCDITQSHDTCGHRLRTSHQSCVFVWLHKQTRSATRCHIAPGTPLL